jgi:hypothetical protein
MNRRLCIVWAVFVAATSSPALAEGRTEREDRQVGAAVEWSSFVEGWGGAGSFRQWRGSLGLDVSAAIWTSDSRGGYPVVTISDRTSRSGFSAGVSVLARAKAGRFAAIAGVGPALFSARASTRTNVGGVERVERFSSGGLGVRLLFEVEADLTRRLSGFAGARAEWPTLRHPGLGSGALSAGMRVRF